MDPEAIRAALLGRPCWYCRHWAGVATRYVAHCNRPGNPKVKSLPERGCAFFEREPGVDDDGWEPENRGSAPRVA